MTTQAIAGDPPSFRQEAAHRIVAASFDGDLAGSARHERAGSPWGVPCVYDELMGKGCALGADLVKSGSFFMTVRAVVIETGAANPLST